MKNSKFIAATTFSVVCHLVLLSFFLWEAPQRTLESKWSGGNTIALDVIPVSLKSESQPQLKSKNTKSKIVQKQKNKKSQSQKRIPQSGQGISKTPKLGKGSGLDQNGSRTASILAKIRKRILRNHIYPQEAKNDQLTGTVKIAFSILESGQVQNPQILKSSGSKILDQAALKSLKQSEPLPHFPHRIALPFEYQLH